MKARSSLAAVAVGVVVALFAPVPAPAASGQPAGPNSQAYQALMLRSQALNVLYGLGKPGSMTEEQYRAMLIQGAALNARYGATVAQSADEIAQTYGSRVSELYATPVSATSGGGGFHWTDAGIGAAFIAGLLALGVAGAATIRRHPIGRLRHH